MLRSRGEADSRMRENVSKLTLICSFFTELEVVYRTCVGTALERDWPSSSPVSGASVLPLPLRVSN